MTLDVNTQIAILDQKYTQVVELSEKMSLAIEKIADVSGELQRAIAVSDERISTQKRSGDNLTTMLATQREEFQKDILKVQNDLSTKITDSEARITRTLTDMKTGLGSEHSALKEKNVVLETRINTLERWRFTLVGAGFVIGGFIAYILPPILSKMLHITP